MGEPGINDPNVKIGVTIATFLALYGIQAAGYDDPSILTTYNSTTADLSTNFHLPLKEVCHRQACAAEGIACFALIRFSGAYWSNCRNKSTPSSSNAGHSASHGFGCHRGKPS